ncbi:MAG: NAD-dependent epimerase/dehydratase family protein [Defluviitaleaceae bacterium]|nr:NAD-dependent epimerase/dehydratase family protein [Defluviitaleaceae bacterium]
MEAIFARTDYSSMIGKTIVITGAYGMLASYMVYFMIYLNKVKSYNIKIISLSRDSEKLRSRFGVYCDNIVQIACSVNDPMDIDCDFIIHAASLASPQYYSTSPIEVILPNILGTKNLLELACIKKARLLYFSSVSVYGSFPNGHKPVSENNFGWIDPLDLHSCYDEGKRAGESLCAAYFRQKGVNSVIARIAHTYGPTMDIEGDPRVFASFIKNALRGENIEIKSDGTAKRLFCYISDATAAYFKLLIDGKPGEAYNVCNTEESISIRQLGEIVSNISGVDFIFKERCASEMYLNDSNPDNITFLNDKLIALGFEFKVGAVEGFKRVLDYFNKESST